MDKSVGSDLITEIKPVRGFQFIPWNELWRYRDLFVFLVWRDIKARYAQSVLGVGWAVVQPVVRMIIFTIIFGKMVKIDSNGVPYAIFSYVALVPWTYFSSSLQGAGNSIMGSSNLLTKVYVPRLILPLSSVLSKFIDFVIAGIIVVVLLIWYRITPTPHLWLIPFLILIMMLASAGLGMVLTALGVQYRDVSYAMGFFIQTLMYVSPVVYSTSIVPDKYRFWYSLNPMVGVIEGFRAVIIGATPVPWQDIGVALLVSVVLFIGGILYFNKMEKNFADVI